MDMEMDLLMDIDNFPLFIQIRIINIYFFIDLNNQINDIETETFIRTTMQ